jgi:hypothetical protein
MESLEELRKEKHDLRFRILNVKSLLNSEEVLKIPGRHFKLLAKQYKIMNSYGRILGMRKKILEKN